MSQMVFCFPHSGATTAVFRAWRACSGLRVRPVDRPGRGPRVAESPAPDLAHLIEGSARLLSDELATDSDMPWSVFGHSFGSTLAFLVAARTAELVGRAPHSIVVSAGLPPHRQDPANEIDHLDDDQVRAHLIEIGGTPAAVLDSPLGAHLVRYFRQDHAYRAHLCEYGSVRAPGPLLSLAAADDPYAPPPVVAEWAAYAPHGHRQVVVPGDHFAPLNLPEQILALIAAPGGDHDPL